jgi:hypothetical protein
MPQQNRPITDRPKVEDTSTGSPDRQEGKPQPHDQSVAGKGSEKGGLNTSGGAAEAQDDAGTRQGSGDQRAGGNADR